MKIHYPFPKHLGRFVLVMILCLPWLDSALGNERTTCFKSTGIPAIDACRKLLRKDPNDLNVLIKLSDHLAQQQKYAEALQIIRQAAVLNPDSPKVEHRMKKLISYQKEQEWAEKRKSNPDTTKALTASITFKRNRIKCLRLNGEKALEACNKAIQEKEDDHTLYKARGKIQEQLGRNEEAAKDFKLWVKWNPAMKSKERITDHVGTVKIDLKEKKQEQKIAATQIKPVAQAPQTVVAQPAKVDSPAQLQTSPPSLAAGSIVNDKQKAETTGDPSGLAKKLATLKELFDASLIQQEEYEKRKSALLDTLVAGPSPPAPTSTESKTHFSRELLGKYYALVIGEQNYQFLPKLKTAAKDAKDVSHMLKKRYGFEVTTLEDATRRDILLALSDYRQKLTDNDNLLIYYAGHGWLDEKADTGYWIPVEAVEGNRVDWISMATLTSSVRALEAKHVLIVADSCFSGKLARGFMGQDKSANYLERIAQKRTRVVLTSGGLEPVLDGGGKGGHSVFAATFLEALEENNDIMDGSTLFTKIRRPVMLKAQQVPEYSDIRLAGHEGGDFIFAPVKGGK